MVGPTLDAGADASDSVGLWLGAAALSFIDEQRIDALYFLVGSTAERSRFALLRETAEWIRERWGGPAPSARAAL
ncbi:MAG: hypothetical protein R3190_18500 [Thermoanaerobaculia bacterium]|nr:hypothetical protein [Thermoanaerobaculia bacterium]